jgi:uncharacterized protein YbjT (DUF2867 family)
VDIYGRTGFTLARCCGHQEKIYDITGPESLTHSELASHLSEALGRQITFVDIPETAMRSALLSFGLPEW